MNEPYIQDRSIQTSVLICPRTGSASMTQVPICGMHGFLIVLQWDQGQGGHLPVGGDSLLVAQAGGGSCTRRGELKLRRKEEHCGKNGQRESMAMSQPAKHWPSPSTRTTAHEEPGLGARISPHASHGSPQPASSAWLPLTVLTGHCWWEISSEHQRWTLTLHVLHRKPCLELPGNNAGLVKRRHVRGRGAKEGRKGVGREQGWGIRMPASGPNTYPSHGYLAVSLP